MGAAQPLTQNRNKRRRDDAAPGTGGKPGASGKNEGLYHCDYCHKDLSSTLRIKCAACKDFDLCLECFSVGVQLNVAGHTNDHPYKVVQSLGFPLYHPAWRADEELLLLEGIEIYGLGNWPKVAEHVGKTMEEVRGHYLATYIDHPGAPLPQRDGTMAGMDVEQLVAEYRRTGRDMLAQRAAAASGLPPHPKRGKGSKGGGVKQEEGAAAGAEVKEEEGEEGMDVDVKAEGEDADGRQQTAATAAGGSEQGGEEAEGPAAKTGGKKHRSAEPEAAARQAGGAAPPADPGHRTQGTFALRPVAAPLPGEVLGSPLAKTPGGGEQGKIPAAAEAQQTGYHIKRNEFEPEWDFEAETIISELADFRSGDDADEASQKDRLIAIYNRRLDERERRRQFVLDRGLLNVKRQQAIDKRRTAPERELHGSLRVLARHLPQDQFEALAEGLVVEQRLRARIAELQEYRAQGLRTFEQVDEVEALQEGRRKKEQQQQQQQSAIRNRINRVQLDEGALAEALVETADAAHAAAALAQQHTVLPDGRGHGMAPWRHKRGVLLDITSLPDAEALTRAERNLCATERYLPAQYLAVKAAALRLQDQKGRVSRQDVTRMPFQVDEQRMARLHDFFVGQGWVVPGAAGKADQRQQQQRWEGE